jgi:hypothetical protein
MVCGETIWLKTGPNQQDLVAKSAERFEKYICKLIYFYAVIYSR